VAKSRKLAPLNEQEEEEAETLMYPTTNKLVADRFNTELMTSHLTCLRDGEWLNDEVINFYMGLLNERSKRLLSAPVEGFGHAIQALKCHHFTTFFYTKLNDRGKYNYRGVQRWSRAAKVDVISMDKVIFPVNINNNHWCLAVINFVDKRFEYYDSLQGKNPKCLQFLRQYVVDEAKTYHPKEYGSKDYDLSEWKDVMVTALPRQNNGCDCGVFTCKFADFVSEGRDVNEFTQRDMAYFRRRIALELRNQFIM